MDNYGFLVGPYFLGFVIIVATLCLITIWSGRATLTRAGALVLGLIAAYLSFVVVDDLLSRPKPVTFAELQSQIPDGHPGHLVLYGEATEEGVFLLLRSPAYKEPRYFFMTPPNKEQGKKMKENFEKAQRKAKEKGTQLLLGGKLKKNNGKGDKKGKKGDGKKDKDGGIEDVEMEEIFHPAPVSGGPEKDTSPADPTLNFGP